MNTLSLITRTLESREHADAAIDFTHPVVNAALEISRARLHQNYGQPPSAQLEMPHGAMLVDAYERQKAAA
jgi:hypothetical protein